MASCKFAAPQHAKRFRRVRIFDANRNVGEQFLRQAVAQVARGQIAAFFAGKRAAVHGKNHGERRLVDQQRLERRRIQKIRDAFADLDSFHAGDGDKIARANSLRFIALQSTKRVELGDPRGDKFSIQLADADIFAALQRAVKHAANRDAPEKIAVVQIHNLNLQHAIGIARRRRNAFHDGFKQRQQILRVVPDLPVRNAFARVCVDHWKIELVFCGVQVDKQVVDFIEHFFCARIRAVDLVQHNHRR